VRRGFMKMISRIVSVALLLAVLSSAILLFFLLRPEDEKGARPVFGFNY